MGFLGKEKDDADGHQVGEGQDSGRDHGHEGQARAGQEHNRKVQGRDSEGAEGQGAGAEHIHHVMIKWASGES